MSAGTQPAAVAALHRKGMLLAATAFLLKPRIRRRWKLSLRIRLLALVLGAVLPIFCYSVINGYVDCRASVERAGHEKLLLARGLAGAVDNELQKYVTTMQVLAQSKWLRDGDRRGFVAQAQSVVAEQFPGATVLLLGEDGHVEISTAAASSMVPWREDLDSVRKIFSTGRPVVSNIFFEAIIGRHVIAVEVPVRNDEGRVTGVLAVIPTVEAFSGLIARLHAPSDWIVTVLDRHGVIAARGADARQYFGQKANSQLLSRVFADAEGYLETESREGAPILGVFAHSEILGWAVAISIPSSELTVPAIRSLLVTLALGGGSLVAGLLLALFAASRISGPIGSLRDLALAANEDEQISLQATGLPEVDEVAAALRTAQQNRQRSEKRYRTLFDANPHAMCVYDVETLRFLEVNSAAVHQYGWSREELLGMTLLDIRPPEEIAALRDVHAAAPRDLYSEQHWRKDGTRFDAQTVGRSVEVDGRRVRLALSHDVTDQNLTRTRLADAIHAFPGTFQLFDRNGRLVVANGKPWMPANVDSVATIGDSIEKVVRSAADAGADMASAGRKEEWYRERLAQFHRGQTDIDIRTSDGRWSHLVERRTPDGSTISLRLDITARKIVEEQLHQAQKMEAVGQMTGGIAHDFNNILAIILMKMEILEDELPADSAYLAYVRGTSAAAARGVDLVQRLLSFSRLRKLDAVKTDVAGLLANFKPLLDAAVPQVKLTIEAADDLPPCLVDRTGLETAILNLAVNARDAMPNGGPLRITARSRTIDEDEANQRAGLVAGDWVEIAVIDSGSGIAPDVLSQVFEPFFTTKAEGKGTGLGLSMVFGFATESGGFVTVDSAVGQGTTIALYLRPAPELGGAGRM